MKHYIKLISITFGLLLVAQPALVLAQAKMESASYRWTDINFGSDTSLTTTQDSLPPSISSQGPLITLLEPRKAIIEWSTDKKSSSLVRYGTTTSYGSEASSAGFVTKHKVTLFDLTPETLYHFKVVSIDSFDVSGESADATFTTPAEAGINSISVTDIGYDKAVISWKTGNFTTSELEYGTTTSYGQKRSSSSLSFVTDHTARLTDLTPGTQYHFRIVAKTDDGKSTIQSSDQTFTTIAEPRFESVTTNLRSVNEVVVTWRTNTETSGIITYRTTINGKEERQTAGSSAFQRTHSVTLNKLIGNTSYNFDIVASDAQGRQVNSGRRTFTTPVDKNAPVISELKVSVTRSGDELVLNAKWKSDEPARGEIVFSPKTRADATTSVPGSSSLVTDHTIIATGLTPGTPYSLTAFATDSSGNRGQAEISFVSPRLNKSIFQLIADAFLSRFGWLLNLIQR